MWHFFPNMSLPGMIKGFVASQCKVFGLLLMAEFPCTPWNMILVRGSGEKMHFIKCFFVCRIFRTESNLFFQLAKANLLLS